MEARESAAAGQRCSASKEVAAKEKVPLQRKWVSEPSASARRSTFADPEGKHHRESLPGGATGGAAPQQKYVFTENSGTLLSGPSAGGAMGGPLSQDPQGAFAQGFPRGFPYQLGQPYPQHPQTEHFASGAKPQPGLEPHAWPFAGQLPSDDLYPVGHTHHPHGAGAARFQRHKSPSLPSSFGQYSQSGAEPGEEGYCKKDQKPKKPGKYKCNFCGRACAKPSVLKKHIRSHTGERPYPCEPCGFSFKTKSNLYKHRKSHAHAIKARLAPFPELALAHSREMDRASPGGEAEVHSDGDQSTDTDEEGVDGPTMLTDKDGPVPQISFEADKSAGGAEPAYADSAEDLPVGSMKVPILIVPRPGGVPSAGMDFKGSHHMLASQPGGRAHSLDDCPSIKQRLALILTEKKGQDCESALSQSLNLLSPHSKGSTDSGYFSRSESAEQQISPPNTNAKSYEEIMFGRTWYYGPNSRSRQPATAGLAGTDPGALASLKQSGAALDMGKIAEGHISFRGEVGISGDPKQYPAGPCQSSTGLLEPPSDSGTLIRSNSMPTSSPPNLSVPPGIRGSHSFDEMMTSDDVFYPPRSRLTRQTAFELSANEAHVGEAEGHGHVAKNVVPSLGIKIDERNPGVPTEYVAYSPYGTKVSMSEIATRKRRKENSVGDEEDSPGHGDSSCSGSVEIVGDSDFKQGSLDGSRATPTGKGSLHSAHSQSDSFDTCTSMCSEDIAMFADPEGRKTAGNVISVIQHTNSLSRPSSFEKSESFEQPGYQPSDKPLCSQYSEQSDTEIYEDALSPESILLRTESMEQQLQSDSDPASLTSSAAPAPGLPGQPYHIPHKLVRQPNIQVPEIRVTEEPDKPEREAEAPTTVKEPEKQQQQQQHQQHTEDFQLPQRSDTLSQMPSEKLPPKKKRLRLTDMEHSSGESSFESTCTSLSRSPSQESNLSHSSSFSMSFDRDEGLKSVSPTKQDDSTSCGGPKQSEFLTVPGSAHSSHHQQREMRRSSSEQAPCTLPTELTEMRSKSFDYGNLPSSRQGEVYSSASAMKERRRGYLVRQPSLSVYPETVAQEGGVAEMLIKQESLEHSPWPGPAGSSHSADDLTCRSKRVGTSLGGLGTPHQHHQHFLQQSMSEDSLQDEPLHGRLQQHRLQGQGSSSEGEYPGHEIQAYPSGPPYLPFQQAGLLWSQEVSQNPRQQLTLQAQQQLQKLHIRSPGSLPGLSLQKQQVLLSHQQQIHDGKPDNMSGPKYQPASLSSHTFPLAAKHSPSSPTASPAHLQQIQPVFATQNLGCQASGPSLLVPVRIQTHVPSFGSIMYTSVSQLVAAHDNVAAQVVGSARRGVPDQQTDGNPSLHAPASGASQPPSLIPHGMGGAGFNLAHFLGQTDGTTMRSPLFKSPGSLPEQQLNTGIPLSLTSGTISTTDASASTSGGGKRMLSPTSSLEIFFETSQQKRVKEQKMYGQILREMSAVELSGREGGPRSEKGQGRGQRGRLKSEDSIDDSERMASSPPLADFSAAPKIAVPVRSCAPHLPDVPRPESFTPPLQIVTDRLPVLDGRDSPEELHMDQVVSEPASSPRTGTAMSDAEGADGTSKVPVNTLVQLGAARSRTGPPGPGRSLLLSDVTDVRRFLPSFPSLRTTCRVSWCFLNYTKPSSGPANTLASVYGSWCISSYEPNPLGLSTKAALALLRSKQRRNHSDSVYSTAATSPPSSGKLVSSVAWKLRFDQLKPELMPTADMGHFGRKMKGVVVSSSWDRSKEEHGEKDGSVKQPTANEPTRIKIFEGGYKSNEDYVYVRGRGRGKYICEECGIRCKKPSMLKKHIRTHTDVRPYVCKFCNFAFKTKGNLTKHMKSKAHMKKCLELGVSTSSVEDNECDDGDLGDEGQRSERSSRSTLAEHQFSDADDSEDDGEEDGEEEEEEEEYDGDSTPLARSRSASPQPFAAPAPGSQHAPRLASELLGRPPPFGYFTTVPSIRITPQAPPPGLQGAEPRLDDLPFPSPDRSSSSSGCPSPLSPGSSPSAQRYLSPRRDLSPHLSPRRHPSPKRELGVSGGFRRDSSPRRGGHLSLLSPLSRPSSPAGRDYKRDLSPRGRPRGLIRALSPRRGLHPHLHHLSSQQGGARSLRPGHQSAPPGHSGRRRGSGSDMETDGPGSPGGRSQGGSSPPRQVLFSHLPLHSQVTVRSLFPMIPIGGIQMVHAPVAAPLGQQGAPQPQGGSGRLLPRRGPSEDSAPAQAAASPHLREWPMESRQDLGGGAKGGPLGAEPEEGVHTCTEAIASLCIASEEVGERGGGARATPSPSCSASFPVAPPTDSRHQQQRSPSIPASPPSPPPGPRIQHFSGPELRPPYPSAPGAATPPAPHHAELLPATSKPVRLERAGEGESWSKGPS